MRLIAIASAAIAVMTASSAHAGPCTTDIARAEQQIAVNGASVAVGPSAPQSLDAQLGHQPTPSTVQGAEQQASAAGQAALNRVRTADAAGNLAACRQALGELKDVYGLP
jgi:hypothetical protein